MKIFKMFSLTSALALATIVVSSSASASPIDGNATWSWGPLRVADIGHGGDNDVYVQFRNADGTIRNRWPNASGAEICGGSATLRLARGRTNFKEMLESLNIAGLSGRTVWVWYEPTDRVCYIKRLGVAMQ
ncbi:hypothetical protein [Sorangium sp. So ce385]|uniref:hypothetical protein n=1 Tax=Sorangium sp. So ce385 TaxID=3133308 RepID=UPI003F5BC142